MRLFRVFAAALAVMALVGCQEDADTGLHTSPAGHSFAFLPLPQSKTVSLQVVWPMPWALDETHNPVVPHLAVKLVLLGGAVGLPARSLQEKMTELGAEAYLAETGVTVRTALTSPPDVLDEAAALTNAVLRSPALPNGLLEQLRVAAVQSQAEIYSNPTEQAFLALRMVIMRDQPNYAESLSFANTDMIKSVTLAEVQRWHDETFVSNGALIAVAGPIDVAAAGRAVDVLFKGLPNTAAPQAIVGPMNLGPRRILMHVPSAQNTTLAVIAAMPPTGDAGEMDDIIGSFILGGDDQAVLAKSLTSRLGNPTVFTAAIDAFSRKNRILVMSGQIKTDQTAAVLLEVTQAYAQMASQPQPQSELTRWADKLAASLASVENDPTNRAGAMLESMIDGNNPMVILQLEDMLSKVTPTTVQQRFASAFAPARDLIFVAISPDAKAMPNACIILQPKDVLDCP